MGSQNRLVLGAAGKITAAEQLIKLRNLTAEVTLGNKEKLITVDNISLTIDRGESCAIVGKSGSGKTSLISILGFLNTAFSGEYYFDGRLVSDLSDKQLARLRATKVGFVFQNYSLIKHLKVLENVELALQYQNLYLSRKIRRKRALDALAAVGLAKKAGEKPANLSGGEQQRVAIARSLVTEPELLICDEPTGALDKQTGAQVLDLLHSRVAESKVTLLLVTHDTEIAASCLKTYRLDGGKLV